MLWSSRASLTLKILEAVSLTEHVSALEVFIEILLAATVTDVPWKNKRFARACGVSHDMRMRTWATGA